MRSNTSKSRTSENPLETPVQFIKGVGPKLGQIFSGKLIRTVNELLYFFPRTYEDRTTVRKVSDLQDGEKATVSLRVIGARRIPLRNGRTIFEVRCQDATEEEFSGLKLKFFHFNRGMESQYRAGRELRAIGKTKFFMNQAEMVHPEVSWSSISGGDESVSAKKENAQLGRIVPVYVEIEGVSTRTLRKVLWNAINSHLKFAKEDIPKSLLEKYSLPSITESIREIHFPSSSSAESGGEGSPEKTMRAFEEFRTPFQIRLVYEELLKFQYLVLLNRLRSETKKSWKYPKSIESQAAVYASQLPFELTDGQKETLSAILKDLESGAPMNRLIQGDVGSGKTVVALIAAALAMESTKRKGHQAALMAPTEILAEQHLSTTRKFFPDLPVALLTGNTSKKERKEIQARLSGEESLLLIGTHALIEDAIQFSHLRLIIVDEQHRFGVEQRRILNHKGVVSNESGTTLPHTLSLSATPIPRTLALTAYGDLSISTIRELPKGRKPIKTQIVLERNRARAYSEIAKELREGRQAYFIFPLIQKSEAEGFDHLKSATEEFETLKNVFEGFECGLLHGQIKSEEKESIVQAFKRGEIHVLVSTTVVEVGVDVPNATVMAIEHSERFGLSQLHQLRGRVGRGEHQSHCYLFTSRPPAEVAALRLDALEETTDGFRIAEVDLEIRGPGEFLGTRQSGSLPFKMADLVRDAEWVARARQDAEALLNNDPSLGAPENQRLRAYLQREGKAQFERLQTS